MDSPYLAQLRKQLNDQNAQPKPKPAPAAPPPPPVPAQERGREAPGRSMALAPTGQRFDAPFTSAQGKVDEARQRYQQAMHAQDVAYRTQLQDAHPLLKHTGSHADQPNLGGTFVGNQGTFLRDQQGAGYYVPQGGHRALEALTSPEKSNFTGAYDYDPGAGPPEQGAYGPSQDPRTGNFRTSPTEEYEAIKRHRQLGDLGPQEVPEQTVAASPPPTWGHPDESPMSNEDRLKMAMRDATDANMRQKKQAEEQRANVPADWLQFGEKP